MAATAEGAGFIVPSDLHNAVDSSLRLYVCSCKSFVVNVPVAMPLMHALGDL